jgi:Holliday junction resolvase RusA-like endonuclease
LHKQERLFSSVLYKKALPKIYGNRVDSYCPLQQRELANDPFRELHPSQIEPFADPADGYYYPVQLDDTYALLMDYSGELQNGTENLEPQALDTKPFRDRQQEVIRRLHGEAFTLGQTWVLRATLTSPQQQPDAIARKCYQQTFPTADWDTDYLGQGQLLGGKLYELWQYPRAVNNAATTIASSQHVLIWLFPHSEIPQATLNKQIATTYKQLIRLFHYRHKIWAAYAESQATTTHLKAEVTNINQISDRVRSSQSAIIPTLQSGSIVKSSTGAIVKPDLDQLQTSLLDTLKHFDTYTDRLQQLGDTGRTIDTNRANYRDRVKEIATEYPDSDLKFLDEFNSDRHADRYTRQIAADYAVLAPRLNYLEKLNQTIDNTIQIEQTKSSIEQARIDRQTNKIVAVAGIGLASSQVASAAIIAQHPPGTGKEFFMLTPPFYGSILTGAIASILTWLIIRRRN